MKKLLLVCALSIVTASLFAQIDARKIITADNVNSAQGITPRDDYFVYLKSLTGFVAPCYCDPDMLVEDFIKGFVRPYMQVPIGSRVGLISRGILLRENLSLAENQVMCGDIIMVVIMGW